jgi:hypothetical protein
LKKAFDQARFSSDPFHRVAQFYTEMRDIEAAHIAQVDPFELLPEAFTRVQLQGIAWQPPEVQPLYGRMGVWPTGAYVHTTLGRR